MRSTESEGISKRARIAGYVISTLVVLFLLMDGVMKLFKPAFVVEATVRLGFPESTIVGIGVALVAFTLLYVISSTSILGAILLTAYLGGAVATNVRAASGWFNIAFPIVFGILIWGSLWLRNRRVRNLFPVFEEAPAARSMGRVGVITQH